MKQPRLAMLSLGIALGILPLSMAFSLLLLYRSPYHGENIDPLACFIMAGFAAAAMWFGRNQAVRVIEVLSRAIAQSPRRALWGLVLVSLLSYTGIAYVVLDGFANSGDEYTYVLQAQTFALGRLWVEAPPVADVFRLCQFYDVNSIWLSQYPPGWSIILAIFTAASLPLWIVNPIIGAVTLAVFYALARRYVEPGLAWLGAALLGSSAFFAFNSASFFNHSLAALTGLAAVLFGVRFLQQGRRRDAVLAGIFIGVLGITRTQNAVLFAVPMIIALLLTPGRRLGVVWIAVGGAPLLVGLLSYNGLITGNPLIAVQNWHKSETFTAPNIDALRHTVNRLARLQTWTSPVLLIAYVGAFVLTIKRRALQFPDWIMPITGICFLIYGGYGGNQYGPRYYYEAWPLALLTIIKVLPLFLDLETRSAEKWTASAILVALTMQIAYFIPRIARERRVIVERTAFQRVPDRLHLRNAIILIDQPFGRTRPFIPQDLLRNGLSPATKSVIYALDLPGARSRLIEAFPDRKFYELHDNAPGDGRSIVEDPSPFDDCSGNHPDEVVGR